MEGIALLKEIGFPKSLSDEEHSLHPTPDEHDNLLREEMEEIAVLKEIGFPKSLSDEEHSLHPTPDGNDNLLRGEMEEIALLKELVFQYLIQVKNIPPLKGTYPFKPVGATFEAYFSFNPYGER